MKIVILDAATVTKGDIDFNLFSKYGEVTIYPGTNPNDLPERVLDADIILCNKTVLGERELKGADKLKLICLFATGYNNIDTVYCKEHGICVCNAGTYSTESVAQHTFALILDHFSRVGDYNNAVQNKAWMNSATFSMFVLPTDEICGKTLGIVGLGSIGQRVAEIGRAFHMNVLAATRTPKNISGVKEVSYEELLRESDIITFHCPLTEKTKGMFGEKEIDKCKDGVFIVNTSRGPVIDQNAMIAALKSGKLSGASIDVLEKEPMPSDCNLLGVPNLVITPHVAWTPYTTRVRVCRIVCENIEAFLAGRPQNKVN